MFKPGDVVAIVSDSQKLQRLQEGHGGWVSEMKQVRHGVGMQEYGCVKR